MGLGWGRTRASDLDARIIVSTMPMLWVSLGYLSIACCPCIDDASQIDMLYHRAQAGFQGPTLSIRHSESWARSFVKIDSCRHGATGQCNDRVRIGMSISLCLPSQTEPPQYLCLSKSRRRAASRFSCSQSPERIGKTCLYFLRGKQHKRKQYTILPQRVDAFAVIVATISICMFTRDKPPRWLGRWSSVLVNAQSDDSWS